MSVECGVHCHAGRHVHHHQTLELSSEVTTELQQRHSHHEPLDPTKPPSATVTSPILHLHSATPLLRRRTTFGPYSIPPCCLAAQHQPGPFE